MEHTQTSQTIEASNLTEPFEFNSHEGIQSWYRNLRPDTNINEVPLNDHLDAIASSVLLHRQGDTTTLPESMEARVRKALETTTDGVRAVANSVALNGPDAFGLLDLLTELPERDSSPVPPSVTLRLLELGKFAAEGVRENNGLDMLTRFEAHNKLTNLRIAELTYAQQHVPDRVTDFNGAYKKIIQDEARWVTTHSNHVPAGNLFETYIGCIGKYAAFAKNIHTDVLVRHATMREDKPNPAHEGGGGFKFAHDVTIRYDNREAWLQCKWGSGSEELKGRYDTRKVTFISETTDDGTFAESTQLAEAFSDIANDEQSIDAQEKMTTYIERYGINSVLENITTDLPLQIGNRALATVTSR